MKKSRKTLRIATLMLAAITIVIWLILFIIKLYTTGMNYSTLLDDILSNLLGILPPIIIFNFVYEYLSKEYVSEEISQQILTTLTGNSDKMNALFKEDVRRNFIKSTIQSFVGEKKIEMAYGVLEPYIRKQTYKMKVDYKYMIRLEEYYSHKKSVEDNLFDPKNYYYLCESLSYKRIYSEKSMHHNSFKVGFFVDTSDLEKELVGDGYIFRERLNIESSVLEKLTGLPNDKKLEFVKHCLEVKLFINEKSASIKSVTIDYNGISLDMSIDTTEEYEVLDFTITFRLPHRRSRSEFLVSINEPTYSPEITFIYNPSITKVIPYQFLNDDSKLIKDNERMEGQIEIAPHGWIYPIKGLLFIIEDNNA